MSVHQTKTFDPITGTADELPNQFEAQRIADQIVSRMSPEEIFSLYVKFLDDNQFIQDMWDDTETPSSNINNMVKYCYTLMILYINVFHIGWQVDIETIMDDPEQQYNRLRDLYDEDGIEWDLWG